MNEFLISLSSDYQCGASVGLIMPGREQLPDGGSYYPSPAQRLISDQYEHCVHKEAELRKNKRLIEIFNGDAVENGKELGFEQIISPNVEVHKNIFTRAFDYRLRKVQHSKKGGDLLYFVGGTGAHVGRSFQHENGLAKDFGAVPFLAPTDHNEDGWWVWDHLMLDVNGCLIDVAHTGAGIGHRKHTWESNLYNTVKSVYFECIDLGIPVPRYWIRAHNHRFAQATFHGDQGDITGIIMPCFELRTHYVNAASGSQTIADIGQIYLSIDCHGNGTLHKEYKRITERRLDRFMQRIR